MSKVVIIAYLILLLFAFFGLVVGGNLIHELSHQQDFKEYTYNNNICYLALPSNFTIKNFFSGSGAFYSYSNTDENQREIDRISRYTEWKAYGLDGVLAFIFIISLIIVWHNRKI